MVFLAWGKPAGTRVAKINKSKHCVLQSVHPSPLSAHGGFVSSTLRKIDDDMVRKKWLTVNFVGVV